MIMIDGARNGFVGGGVFPIAWAHNASAVQCEAVYSTLQR